jgi:hypothetical protein
MKIGLAGAHRVGKTTLAQKIVEHLPHMQFAATNITSSPVWEHYGINPSDSFTFVERLAIQQQLFFHLKNVVQNSSPDAIFDRTYIDLLGYLYSNIDSTCSSLFDSQVMNFTIQCMNSLTTDFHKIIIIPPSIEPVAADNKVGKVFMSRGYIEAINNHIVSYAVRSNVPYVIMPFEMTDFDERIAWCVSQITNFRNY